MTRIHHDDTRVACTVWTEPSAKRGEPATFTVRDRDSEQILFGPTIDTFAAARACARLNSPEEMRERIRRRSGTEFSAWATHGHVESNEQHVALARQVLRHAA